MCLHLGAWPWATAEVDPEDWTNLPPDDKRRLIRWGGGVPFLAYSYSPGVGDYKVETWAWLSEHGYRDCVLRLWAGELDDPAAFVASQRQGIERAIGAGMQVILQPANEPNLEYPAMGAAGFAAWESAVIDELRRVFPSCGVASSPMAQDAPNTIEWRQAQRANVEKADYLGWHYYWGRKPGDDQPGAPESPEWAHNVYPGKQIVVTECGNWADKHDVRTVLRRWLADPLIRSWHHFIMSSPGWPQFNYDDDLVNLTTDLCREWREARHYPRGATVPSQPPGGGGDLPNLAQLKEHLSALDALGSMVVLYSERVGNWGGEVRDRAAAIVSDYGIKY